MQELEKISEEIEKLRMTYSFQSERGQRLSRNNNMIIDATEKIIRKHMNDVWIPVEERLPEEEYYPALCVTNENYYCVAVYNKTHGFRTGDICAVGEIVAWRPLPELYRPERRERMKYIASWSGGKDSTASILLAHEHNEPIDLIIFSEVMFDKTTSGELPEHIDFVKNKAIPIFESWGYETKILHADKTYMDCFHHRTVRGKNIGNKKGFVMSGHCDVQRDCKLKPIREYWKNQSEDIVQYIGIAIDEHKRLERIAETKNELSLLEKYGYTEQMAYDLCKKYDLLSPIYEFAPRGGAVGFARMPEMQN